ncbi:MAG: surface protein [Ulvibacter sp.]|jgi:surface protein
MKTIAPILIILLVPLFGISQIIEKSSIHSGGASALAGDIEVLYTLGEVNLQELAAGDIQVSEGFINPMQAFAPDPVLFITKWVVNAGQTITIPTKGGGYLYNVDWSYDEVDGFNADSSNITVDATSPVLTAGEHIVAISGDFPRIYFDNSGDKDKITEIVQWGTNPWTTMLKAFDGCSNLNITNIDVGVPNLSSVTSMKRMFYGASSFNGEIGNWDISNVEDMVFLLARCASFNQDLSNWDTSNVLYMTRMFYKAFAFDQDLGAWDISSVLDMESMFFDVTLSTANYDNTLNGWAIDSSGNPSDGIDDIPTNLTFDGGGSRYCNSETSRNLLTTALPAPTGYGWTITDDGLDCFPQESLFITKWVVSAGETITIPTTESGYDYNVDWSYDALDRFNAESMNVTGDATSPVLISAGEYTVAIAGNFPRIYFDNRGDKDKITEIVQWGTNPWTSMLKAFEGCSNLNITNLDVGSPDLSSVTSIRRVFYKATSLNFAIGDWDVSNVTDMTAMFRQAFAFDQDLGAWDIGNVTTLGAMFLNTGISTANYDSTLIGWATDSSGNPSDGVDDIPTNITFDGGNSRYCNAETARNLLKAALPTPTGYGWTITDGGLDCGGEDSYFITKWVVLAGETITIPTKGGGYDYDIDWSYDVLDGFIADAANVTGDVTSPILNVGEHIVAITGNFPRIYFDNSGDKDKITEIVQWGTNPWATMSQSFDGCSNLNITNIDVGEPNLSSVTSMKRMFYGASSFNGEIGGWDVSNVENMTFLFARNFSFNQDISNWNTSNVTMMKRMFYQATVFDQNLSTWDVSNVDNMESMFFKARVFNQDISIWNTSSVIDMSRMFYEASTFDQDLGDWDISKVTDMESMFFDVTLSITNYDGTLIGWSTDDSGVSSDGVDDIPTNITFSAGNSMYCAGETARNLLTAALPTPTGYGWTITDGGGFCDALLGITQSNVDSVSLYPNPTQNMVTIVSPQILLTSAAVYDVQGRKVSEVDFRNQTNYKIDLSDMEAAVYFINIATEKGTVTKRVIKHE